MFLSKPNRRFRDRDGTDDDILVQISAATDQTYARKSRQEQVSNFFSIHR